jgi:ATP-dependent DNA ligase
VLFASDLTEHDGGDLRNLPLIDRKRRLELCSEGDWCVRWFARATSPLTGEDLKCRPGA